MWHLSTKPETVTELDYCLPIPYQYGIPGTGIISNVNSTHMDGSSGFFAHLTQLHPLTSFHWLIMSPLKFTSSKRASLDYVNESYENAQVLRLPPKDLNSCLRNIEATWRKNVWNKNNICDSAAETSIRFVSFVNKNAKVMTYAEFPSGRETLHVF